MNSCQRPPMRNCPICGIAMQASKSRENLRHFDKFECMSCSTVITTAESKPRQSSGEPPAPAGDRAPDANDNQRR